MTNGYRIALGVVFGAVITLILATPHRWTTWETRQSADIGNFSWSTTERGWPLPTWSATKIFIRDEGVEGQRAATQTRNQYRINWLNAILTLLIAVGCGSLLVAPSLRVVECVHGWVGGVSPSRLTRHMSTSVKVTLGIQASVFACGIVLILLQLLKNYLPFILDVVRCYGGAAFTFAAPVCCMVAYLMYRKYGSMFTRRQNIFLIVSSVFILFAWQVAARLLWALVWFSGVTEWQ